MNMPMAMPTMAPIRSPAEESIVRLPLLDRYMVLGELHLHFARDPSVSTRTDPNRLPPLRQMIRAHLPEKLPRPPPSGR